jgi:hypothetical protein
MRTRLRISFIFLLLKLRLVLTRAIDLHFINHEQKESN